MPFLRKNRHFGQRLYVLYKKIFVKGCLKKYLLITCANNK